MEQLSCNESNLLEISSKYYTANEIMQNDISGLDDSKIIDLCNETNLDHSEIIDLCGETISNVHAATFNSSKEDSELSIRNSPTDVKLEQDEVSSRVSQQSSMCFNDTLEEIEYILKHGTNMKENDEKATIHKGVFKEPTHKVSINKHKNCNFDHVISPVRMYIHQKPLCERNVNFKKPNAPLRHSNNRCELLPNFSNVISPVALYIKNSPSSPLIVNIKNKTESKCIPIGKPVVKHLEPQIRQQTLPVHVYKPAAKTLITQRAEYKVPKNIQNLIPMVPEMIKHVQRIHVELAIDNEADGTLSDLNLTEMCKDGHVEDDQYSILEYKKVYNV